MKLEKNRAKLEKIIVWIHNLICLSFRFESHIPENVVDQMNDILVQHKHLLQDESMYIVAE